MAKRIVRKFLNRNKDKSQNGTPTESRVPTPTLDASPSFQVHAKPTSIAAANQPGSTAVPTAPRHEGIGATIVDTLDTVLKLLKEASAALTPLQAAVGGVCECISIYKNVSGNTEQLRSLANDLISRTTFLKPYLNPEDFEVREQQNNGLFRRIVQSEQIAEMVQEFEGKVQGAYEQCKMKILFAVDRNTAEILKEIVLGQLIHSPQAYYDADIGVEFARRLCSVMPCTTDFTTFNPLTLPILCITYPTNPTTAR
ncbi:hypothetical protein BT96DRAFT_1026748 [Gymnopus androsaceus JB14]|uniref:Uncharacterized protein n=1 Tax=Gymnopus androsaceus JB14 TaxID=1447944 RepID=A0A6A4GI46_9AGAR|nr:hypothetical protein BT96DRAFT_1026748 [Gymnopus androsaceus JB14]